MRKKRTEIEENLVRKKRRGLKVVSCVGSMAHPKVKHGTCSRIKCVAPCATKNISGGPARIS